MEKNIRNLIVVTKDYTPFPIAAIGLFKPKDLYLLAGMYLSSHYQRNSNILYTDITIHQLSSLTGVQNEYISESYYPRLKKWLYFLQMCAETA